MKSRAHATLTVLSISAIATTVLLKASVPVGVYAIVEKVVLEPSEAQPQRIQIWGAFSLSDRIPGGYGPAQRGYLYYSCPQGQDTICKTEWQDIKSVAGTGQLIAFGGRNRPRDEVRSAEVKPTSPSPYPIQMGVFKLPSEGSPPEVITRLKAALKQTR